MRPVPHLHPSDSLSSLAEGLIVRFWHVGQRQDLYEAVSLRMEAFQLQKDGVTSTGNESQLLVCHSTSLSVLLLFNQ